MFEELFKRKFDIDRHVRTPLLEERITYLQAWINTNPTQARTTITSIAQYLLRIVEFLPLPTDHIITLNEVEAAADKWAHYKSKHPQKIAFSKTGKRRFLSYALDWLTSMGILEPLPENNIPLFNLIFERCHARKRHTNAPLLKERLLYLRHWLDSGVKDDGLRGIAQYLLISMEYLNLYQLRMVTVNEIENAANCWATNEKIYRRKSNYSPSAKATFIYQSSKWLNMLGYLEKPVKKFIAFEEYLTQYVEYICNEQGLAESTINGRMIILQDLLCEIYEISKNFADISPLTIDEILIKKIKSANFAEERFKHMPP